jgi:5-methylcytosine-specific restriction endonuclease McrA
MVTFGPGVVLPVWGWSDLHQPFHWAGAGILVAAGLVTWPVLVVMVLFILPCAPGLLVPRKWRIAHRRRHGRENCRSARIPGYLRTLVFAADRGRCVYCGNPCLLPGQRQVDHFRPWSQGGMTSLGNLLTLCATHNSVKSNYWPGVWYRPMPGFDNRNEAADIRRVERIRRLNPLRWVRVAWALG